LYAEKRNYSDIAFELGRTTDAVHSRLVKMQTYGEVERHRASPTTIKKWKKTLPMTDSEIRSSYHFAKDPERQILILSDLNACPVSQIKAILKGDGSKCT
jgi:hypothetical protein